MRPFEFIGVVAAIVVLQTGLAGAGGVGLERAGDVRLELTGPVRGYLDAVTAGWLMSTPDTNPAILAMFADRDRPPYRDLLPWSGEFAGKYLTGATQVMAAADSSALRVKLEAFVARLLKLQDSDGYLGPFPKEHRLTGSAPNFGGKMGGTWDAWGHYHAMLGLLLWHDKTGDKPALEAARRIGDLLCDHFLGAKRPRLVDTGSTEMNMAPAHSLALLYRATKDGRHLELARQLVEEFAAVDPRGQPLAGDYFRRGLSGEEFYRLPKPRWESLHPVMALAELYRITGDERYRRAFANLWASIARLDRHNNGGFSSGEQAQGNPYHTGAIETCCTIAWMAMSVEMLKLGGDPLVADELELSLLNAGLGMFSPSGRWSTYNTPMDGDRKANFHEIVFQARPGSPELNCCSVNAARGLGMLSEWALMHDPATDALALNAYLPGRVSARLAGGTRVSLTLDTEYPRSGTVKIAVSPEHALRFPLKLRVPHWSDRTAVQVGGEPVGGVRRGTYLTLEREWKPGDVVTLELDFTTHIWAGEREAAGRISVYRGPILLTYDRRLNPTLPEDPWALDARSLKIHPVAYDGPQPPIVLVEASSDAVTVPIRLCDFASAGADGSTYRTWLRADHATPAAFQKDRPWRSRPVGAGGP